VLLSQPAFSAVQRFLEMSQMLQSVVLLLEPFFAGLAGVWVVVLFFRQLAYSVV
jgi:hypothetical protein